MSPVKVVVPGKTPMERLTNFTKRIIAVSKGEVAREEEKWKRQRPKSRAHKHR